MNELKKIKTYDMGLGLKKLELLSGKEIET